MWTQLTVAKTAKGAINIGQEPIHTAMPRERATRPRYIGLRVNWYGPRVTSLRLAGDVGLISVSSRRNKTKAQTGGMNASATKAVPSSGSGRLGIVGQSSDQLSTTQSTR